MAKIVTWSDNGRIENVNWVAHPGPQTLALSVAGIRELLFGGSRGPGKTDAGIMWMMKEPHISNGNFRALIIRKNSTDLTDWCDRAERWFKYKGGVRSGNPPVFRFPSGALFRTGHLKDKNAYDKYQGHEYQKMLIEELTQIASELSYIKLLSSCRSTIPGLPAQLFATTNPGNVGHHWVKKRWGIGTRKPNVAYRIPQDGRLMMFIPATVTDNPTIMELDPSYKSFLESLPGT